MSKNIEHLQHVKSNVVNNGQPKLPTSSVLVEGELAINYADGYETISLKNSNNEIVRFSSDDYYTATKLGSGFTGSNSGLTVTEVIEENEEITSAALNDLNDRLEDKQDVSGMTNYATTATTQAIASSVNSHTADTTVHVTQSDKTAWNNHTADTTVHVTQSDKTTWNGKADAVHTHVSSGVTAMTNYAIASTSGAVTTTDTLNSAIGKLEKRINDMYALLGSGFTTTNNVTEVTKDNEYVTASALNELKSEINKLSTRVSALEGN